jgi:RNA polymerase sigma factor for flagellar operon FliA
MPRPQSRPYQLDMGRSLPPCLATPVIRLATGDQSERTSEETACPRRILSLVAAADETQALWQDYQKSGDQLLRDRLILTYAPLVKFVAGRVGASLPSHVDEQDLVSYGLLGLIGAIERFDPGRAIKFETFAMARIRGAIIDELRSLDWVPRSVRTRARQIERAIATLEKELMRAPTDAEIAAKLGVTNGELEDSLHEISRTSVAALDELWSPSGSGDQIALIDTIEDEFGPDPETSLELTEIREALAESISSLPEREKLVVTLYYYEELTLREIGEVLGVTESRVSQLHTKAILRLKAHLSGAQREPAEK